MVRTARLEDAAAIAALSGELGYPASAEQMAVRLRDVLARNDCVVFVAEQNGQVVGWIQMVGCHRLEEDPFAEIGGLVVAGAHRSAGIGARLLEAGEQWARERRCHRVIVRSNVVRARAHQFYERTGFVKFKQQAVFAKPLGTDPSATGSGGFRRS